MPAYSLDQSAFAAVRKQLLIWSVTMMLLAGAVGVGLSIVNPAVSPVALGWMGIVLVVTLVVFVRRDLRRKRQQLQTFQIVLEDERLMRRMQDHPDVAIQRNQVTALEELPGRGLFVRTGKRTHSLWISKRVIGYDELREKVGHWHEIRIMSPVLWWWRSQARTLFVTPMLGLLMLAFWSVRPSVVVPSGVIVTAFLLWAFFSTRRNPDIDKRVRRLMWTVWILLVLGVAKVGLTLGWLDPAGK